MIGKLTDNLMSIVTELNPNNTIGKLSDDDQKEIVIFFSKWAATIITTNHSSNIFELTGELTRAFCLGHDWAAKHWTLWKTSSE